MKRLLNDAVHRSRKSFKVVLNNAIRAGLEGRLKTGSAKEFVIKGRPLRLRPGFDPAGFNKLADELETEAQVEKLTRKKKV